MKQAIYNRIVSGVALWLFTSALLSAQTVLDYHEAVAEHPDWVQIPGALIRRGLGTGHCPAPGSPQRCVQDHCPWRGCARGRGDW